MMIDIEQIKDGIAKAIVEMANECYEQHRAHKERAVDIYYAYIGKFKENEEPDQAWQSRFYPKIMKPKILAAWSQWVGAATSNKNMWEVEPRRVSPIASQKAIGMKKRLHENADEADLQEKLKFGAFDKFLYGLMSMQAPVVETRTEIGFELDMSSPAKIYLAMMRKRPMYREVLKQVDFPTILHRNYFEMYPWAYSSDPQAGQGVFHRPLLSRYEMSDLADQPGFDTAVIEDILQHDPAESRYDFSDQKMEARGWSGSRKKGYDLIFFSGKLGRDRLQLNYLPGMEKENGRYVEGLWWVVNHASGPKLIKHALNPTVGKVRPWLMSHYELMPGEAIGMGIGENSVDTAKAIGGAVRLYADGKKLALPMIGVDSKKLENSGNVLEFAPAKIWDFNGTSPKDALFGFSLGDMTAGLIPFIEFLERLHDEITGLPKWTTGVDSKMLNKTATGISMIMNASSQLVRGAIENMDDYILEPLGERWYHWFMKDPNTEAGIKDDYLISASGLTNLMQKEALNPQLLNLLTFVVNPAVTSNPWAMKLLRMVGENVGVKDVDSVLPNPEKLQAQTMLPPAAAAGMVPGSVPGAPAQAPGVPAGPVVPVVGR